jgi:hypothetical protein
MTDAFDDAGAAGIPVVNASLGDDSPSSLAIKTAIAAHPNTLYVVAAGNSSQNVDVTPWTPCDAPYSNVLCVGASDDTDARADFSNYGMNGVDLFAPGVDIASTVPSGYAYKSGTSMATPYTAGVAALVASVTSLRGAALAQRLKDTVDHPTALAGLSVTGGRLNAARAVGAAVDGPSQAVIAGAQGGTTSATITMASRESDIGSYLVYDGGVYVGTSGARVFTINGLAAGSHTFTVVARNTSGMDSAVSAPATVTVQAAPTPAPATPVQERPGTAGLPTTTTPTVTPSSVGGVQIVRRGGRRSLLFRVTGTARITVTLLKLQGGRYRRTSSKTVRMAAGLQSLPITSRLLGMRVPRGRSQVTVGTGAAVATVAFTRR